MKVPIVLVVDDIGTTRFLVTLLEDHGYEAPAPILARKPTHESPNACPICCFSICIWAIWMLRRFSDGHEGGDMISRLSAFQARETNERLSK